MLTQHDIDVARQLAIETQLDLKFPDQYSSKDLGNLAGLTIPDVGTILDDSYQKNLNDQQASDLLDTIIHEGIHYTLPENQWRKINGVRLD